MGHFDCLNQLLFVMDARNRLRYCDSKNRVMPSNNRVVKVSLPLTECSTCVRGNRVATLYCIHCHASFCAGHYDWRHGVDPYSTRTGRQESIMCELCYSRPGHMLCQGYYCSSRYKFNLCSECYKQVHAEAGFCSGGVVGHYPPPPNAPHLAVPVANLKAWYGAENVLFRARMVLE